MRERRGGSVARGELARQFARDRAVIDLLHVVDAGEDHRGVELAAENVDRARDARLAARAEAVEERRGRSCRHWRRARARGKCPVRCACRNRSAPPSVRRSRPRPWAAPRSSRARRRAGGRRGSTPPRRRRRSSAPRAHPPDRGCLSAPVCRARSSGSIRRPSSSPSRRTGCCVQSASVMPPKPGRCPSMLANVLRLPLRMRHAQVGRRQHVEHGARGEARRHREAVAHVDMALAVHRQVDGEEQRRAFGGLGALDQRLHEAAVAHHVKLEPERLVAPPRRRPRSSRSTWWRACTGCRPHARRGRRGSRRRHIACRQSPVGAIASGIASSSPSTVVLRLALRHVDQHALAQLDRAHVVDIGVARVLRIGAGLHVLEEHARHVAAGDPPQVLDAHGVAQVHSSPHCFLTALDSTFGA